MSSRWAARFDGEGRLVSVLEANRDVTDARRLQRAERELTEQLQEQAVELEAQVEEAQSLTEELEASNAQLEGDIPGLQLREGVVTLDGAFEARVFDGRVAVRDLSMRDPLGKYPRLFADIGLENLDLELVTRTFEFGSITGRLSGYVSDLEMFDWMPEAFDAFVYTPPDDRSKRRISQRAVENLSSIGGGSGGGVAAALQGSFLRFFDDFRYDRLGLSCRLANDVCVMGGVMPAPGGYYIVKGAGLPRINVIGSQARVAWTTLVRQLGAAMESEIVVR